MKRTLWTRDFTRITAATALGAAGGIISQFALSFLVFDETGSTLAAALSVAIQLIPMVLLPLIIAPMMDRLPRKPFLVWGDLLNGVCYAGAGLFLLHNAFSYTAYLGFSLLVSCLGAFDELAYNSFYPLLLPEGQEERAYTVSAMLYPILKVLMMPLAALLYDTLGVGRLLLIQAVLSVLAALIENRIRVQENRRDRGPLLSLKTWWRDVREAADYLRRNAACTASMCIWPSPTVWLWATLPCSLLSSARRRGSPPRCIPFSLWRSSPGVPSAELSATAFPCRNESGSASCSGYIRPMS